MEVVDSLLEPGADFGARNGFALLAELAQPAHAALMRGMERFQLDFLARTRPLWGASFPIPGDALGHFSRQWEYPYTWSRLARPRGGRLLDAGSGITFFPFLLAAAGYAVDCCDDDGALGLGGRFARAAALTGYAVTFAETSLTALAYPDDTFDVVTCVSVLEHTGSGCPAVVGELCRVLKPGGRLIATLDLNVSRDDDVRLEDVAVLVAQVESMFELTFPLDLHRPRGLLTSDHFLRHEPWRLPWTWLQLPRNGAASPDFRSIAILGLTADKRPRI